VSGLTIDICGLETEFHTSAGVVKSVRGVDLQIGPGETLCLVGESGSGKSVTAHSIMRLLPPVGRIAAGAVFFEGKNLVEASESDIRRIRGNRISMIFQEPMTSLNPVLRVGPQVAEVLMLHRGLTRREALVQVGQLFERVGISDARRRLDAYPHEMSGGMRQRVMIAMALACEPALIIADEPTTALDVTIQAQILDLLRNLVAHEGSALLLITHDLGVVSETADRVAVMYAGQIVETSPVDRFFSGPLHPYSVGLMRSVPTVEDEDDLTAELYSIPGSVPGMLDLPAGCAFQGRCPHVHDRCRQEDPYLGTVAKDQQVRCWLHVA
jgi:peptide/nickel transport system ATP-binding protein/oligopeptide transport system ATP-binding protein